MTPLTDKISIDGDIPTTIEETISAGWEIPIGAGFPNWHHGDGTHENNSKMSI